MKKVMSIVMLAIGSMAAVAQQQFTKEEQELIDLSNQKWVWMAEKNADRLDELFLENAQFALHTKKESRRMKLFICDNPTLQFSA